MNNLEMDDKKLMLLKRSNLLLEKTRNNYKAYHEERKLLLKLTSNTSIDYEVWEKILDSIEILVNNEKNKT